MTLITDTAALAAFCDRLRARALRRHRHRVHARPHLLAQALPGAGRRRPSEAAAVDPLAPGIDLAPLLDADGRRSGAQGDARGPAGPRDLLPSAAGCRGRSSTPRSRPWCAASARRSPTTRWWASSPGAQLDKSSRFTDWARRPLSEAQIHYALGDVTHLRVIYERWRPDRPGAAGWAGSSRGVGGAARSQALQPSRREDAWRRLKLRSRDARFLAVVQALAAWREREAQRRDLPRAARSSATTCCWRWPPTARSSVEELRALERVNVDRESAAGDRGGDPARHGAGPRSSCPGCRSRRRCRAGSGPPSICCACC